MPIEKISADAPEAKSDDIVADNIAKLKTLFPDLLTEGKDGVAVDVNVLKQLVGDRTVAETEEKYGLNWHGKRRARQLALTPSTGTLRPCPEESVDWKKTQNLMIEGDNLEVLKLLQKSYSGKVKLIYIDPPYNTGKDFVYPDDFQDNIKNYLELTGQVKSGKKMVANTEASGRFHTDWLNMMLPRLRLARNLLRADGALFMSIDDNEVDELKRLGCEVFGEENFVGIISVLVNPRGRHLDKFVAKTHDLLMVFVRNAENNNAILGQAKEGAMLEEYDKKDERGAYRELGLRNRNQAFNPETRPKLFYPIYVDPKSGRVALQKDDTFCEEVLPVTSDGVKTCWTWGKEKVAEEGALLTARQMDDGSWRISRKDYLFSEDGETATTLAKSIWLEKEFNNDYGRKCIKDLFGQPLMDFPKAPELIKRIISIASNDGDIILDFFAGSGTTGHAAYLASAESGQRRFILVQLPEPTRRPKETGIYEESIAWKAGFPTIAELTKERLRRVAAAIQNRNELMEADLGFRVYKLDSSNIREWDPKRDDLAATLEEHAEHLKADRSEADILTEVLLKLGLDLCVPIEQRVVGGVTVHSIGAGALFACLPESITREQVKPLAQGLLAWREELKVAVKTEFVFRDSAFADDVAKTNLSAYLEQNLPESQRGRIRSL